MIGKFEDMLLLRSSKEDLIAFEGVGESDLNFENKQRTPIDLQSDILRRTPLHLNRTDANFNITLI